MRLLNTLAKNGNKDVELCLNEKQYFEAYIMAVRTSNITAEELDEDLYKEMDLKNPKITEDEMETIQVEALDYGL